jgi:curved DNA-binding protein CbpA
MNVDVKACADAKALKKTYLTLVKKHHPDRGGSVEMMKNLTTAYDLLTSMTEGERRDYADRLSGGAAGRPRTTFTRANAPPRPGGYDFNDAYTRNAANQTFRGGMGGRPLRPDPFAARAGEGMHPFVAAMGRVRRWPSSKIIFRGLMMYLVIGSMAFYVLRSYRDYLQQDGWSAAKHYERHTRMQQMQEQRSEIMERVRNRDLHTRFENERERERRIWEAQQAQKQRAAVQLRDMELASWPPLPADGSLGSVYKIPTDPPGVAYFEPPLGVIVQAQTPSASILSAEGTRVVSASDVPAAVAALPPPIK